MTQLTIVANKEPLSRSTDPDTSAIAAERLTTSGKRDSYKSLVLAALRSQAHPVTPRELSVASGIDHPTCHKRLPDLARDGFVVKAERRTCRVTGELAWTWRVVPEE